jgi:hypothetical protein
MSKAQATVGNDKGEGTQMYSAKRLIALATIACWAFLAIGCADDSSTRSVVTVVSINGNKPLQSDVRNWGENPLDASDDMITDDVVEVTMSNFAHDSALWLRPGEPFGDVVFKSYKVTFIRPDNHGPAPASFTGAMYLKVPSSQQNPTDYTPPTGYILLVPGRMKTTDPLDELAYSTDEINVSAYVEFFGTETTSDDPVKATATIGVSFADYVDQN